MERLGELYAFITALCWTVTALAFESAGRRVGSLAVNILRLILALLFFTLYSLIFRSSLLPFDAGAETWLWLSLSGLIGFVLGDLFLFQAFVIIGARISMLIYSIVPFLTALFGWIILGETIGPIGILGMVLTISGIALAVLMKRPEHAALRVAGAKGFFYAVLGSVGQALGLVLSRYGAGDFDAFAATQIRSIAGIIGFAVIFLFFRKWGELKTAFGNGNAMMKISLGAFFGPFLGVSFSLLASQNTQTGIAATIISIVPILLIPPSVLLFKERVSLREAAAALLAVTGVAVLFLF